LLIKPASAATAPSSLIQNLLQILLALSLGKVMKISIIELLLDVIEGLVNTSLRNATKKMAQRITTR
jgi:hypothetical protein